MAGIRKQVRAGPNETGVIRPWLACLARCREGDVGIRESVRSAPGSLARGAHHRIGAVARMDLTGNSQAHSTARLLNIRRSASYLFLRHWLRRPSPAVSGQPAASRVMPRRLA